MTVSDYADSGAVSSGGSVSTVNGRGTERAVFTTSTSELFFLNDFPAGLGRRQ